MRVFSDASLVIANISFEGVAIPAYWGHGTQLEGRSFHLPCMYLTITARVAGHGVKDSR